MALPLVALLVLPTAVAPLGPVDDHEILSFSRGVMPTFFEETRFRPLYYVLRLGETWLWGTNAAGWAFDRLLLALLTVTLIAFIARRYVREPVAILAGLLVIIGPQSEAFYRFGPAEAYAMPMLLGAIFGVLSGRPWMLLFAAAAAFTKETFVIAALLMLALAWWRGYRPFLAGGLVIIAGVGVVVALIHGGTATGGARNLLPWVLLPIAGAVWLSRYRVVPVVMAGALVAGFLVAATGAREWAAMNREWASFVASIPPERPLLIHASVADYERVLALRDFVPGELMLEVEAGSGFLWDRLARVSREGGYGYSPLTRAGVYAAPWTTMMPGPKCPVPVAPGPMTIRPVAPPPAVTRPNDHL